MPDQSNFQAALLDAAQPVPDGLIDGSGTAAGRRYSVYRNNVAVSLTEALQTGFPVLRKLIGDQNFDALAGIYLRAHPPHDPLIMHYGLDMPDFLSKFEPLQHIGYLADVARLELAMRSSYHAADATPLNPETLTQMSPEVLPTAKLQFAPSVRLIRSDWPLHAIWRFNTQDDAPKPANLAEAVLITRAEYDPTPHFADPAAAECVNVLMQSGTIGDAVAAAMALEPSFDFSAVLGLLLAENALTDITT